MKVIQKKILLTITIFILSILYMFSFSTLNAKMIFAETNFTTPEYFTTNEVLTSEVKIGKINVSECLLYPSTTVGPLRISISQNSFIIVLEQNVSGYNDLSYILYSNEGQDYFGYITINDYELLSFENNTETFKTFFDNVKVYKFPNLNSKVIATINNNTDITPLNDLANFNYNDNYFYAISYNDGVAYILKNNVVKKDLFEPTKLELQNNDNENFTQMTAYIILIVSLLILTIFICVKLLKRKKA